MVEPIQLVWVFTIFVMLLALLALTEVNRSNKRRENEVMFDTAAFDEKVKEYNFATKEIHTLEKLVRASKFDNKDAVMNSSTLFETAVLDFYEARDVNSIRDETLDSVALLREKLNFTAKNPLAKIKSTRQFSVGDRVDVILENGSKLKHSEILTKNEKEWSVLYDGSFGPASSFIGKRIRIRWTRPEDAVYSAWLVVKSYTSGSFVIEHAPSSLNIPVPWRRCSCAAGFVKLSISRSMRRSRMVRPAMAVYTTFPPAVFLSGSP